MLPISALPARALFHLWCTGKWLHTVRADGRVHTPWVNENAQQCRWLHSHDPLFLVICDAHPGRWVGWPLAHQQVAAVNTTPADLLPAKYSRSTRRIYKPTFLDWRDYWTPAEGLHIGSLRGLEPGSTDGVWVRGWFRWYRSIRMQNSTVFSGHSYCQYVGLHSDWNRRKLVFDLTSGMFFILNFVGRVGRVGPRKILKFRPAQTSYSILRE